MKLREIQDQINLAEVYKYTCALELEKNKRNNGIFHDFSDIDNFHKTQIDLYDKHIKRLHKQRLDRISQHFNFACSFTFVILFTVLFSFL